MELVNQEFISQKRNQIQDGSMQIKALEKDIILDKVSFSYGDKEKNVLEDISLKINAKQTVAIVGESGSGKSTLVDLITLMHTPIKGEIYVDDIDGREIYKNSWRSQLGYVSQETIIFDDSIINNICMWSGDYKNDKKLLLDIREAAKQANILDFVDSLKDGFDSMVGDRAFFYQRGQRQKTIRSKRII